MYLLYSALLAGWLLVSLPYWLIQMGRHGKYRAGLAGRLGKLEAPRVDGDFRSCPLVHQDDVTESSPGGLTIWIVITHSPFHAVAEAEGIHGCLRAARSWD